VDSKIFRKVSLERLSSPEQLDQILKVTNPKNWVALLAIFILLGVAVAWGYGGSVASKAVGQGLVVRSGGVLNVVTAGAGMVLTLKVGVGDHIQSNQLVATVSQPQLEEKIKDTKEMLAEARGQQELSTKLHSQHEQLQQEALARERQNTDQQIQVLQKQVALATEQLPVDEELLKKGLITKQQTITSRQKIVQLNSQIDSLRTQIKQYDAQKFEIQVEPVQNQVEMQSRIADLHRTLDALNSERAMTTNVRAPYGGQVLEVKVYPGAAVSAGEALVSIQPDIQNLQALIYLPAEKAKSVLPGMGVQISPSTVKREEFGYIRGKVVYVSDFPSTPEVLMRNFENQALVQSLTANGPVTEVRAEMIKDTKTVSGYAWSSSAGPSITLTAGTICTGAVVTRQQKPITLVFPYIKSKLGLS
jgi:HlyD family secretion protein